ncbi:inner membrane transporter yfaV [Phlyctema vagabunda]|uniref:Inner membrane transporter yfaV n=1 Tax=Phlyctema vagabunda TaxID=108571 RepID=A0ABR4PBI9_9HELO
MSDKEEVSERSPSGGENPILWDRAAESRALRKVDTSVLPLLFLGLLVFQLDRMNLASALTAGFAKDVKITQSTINLGNQMMFLGNVVLEIPSNMLLQSLGPRKWIAAQVFVFGIVATMQIFVKDQNGFLVARSALDVSESGYIPGAIYTLSCWYTKRELAKRVAIFFFGMFGANALSPLLASGILKLEGRQDLKGWQWLFLLEGVFTIFVSVLLAFLLPGAPDQPEPLLSRGIIQFKPEEKEILQSRLELDDEAKRNGAQGMNIPWTLIRKTVLHYRRWPHFISTGCVFATWSPMSTYTPSIILSLGFDRIEANALAAVGTSIALGVIFFFAWLSDRTNKRGATVIAAQSCYLISLIIARSVHPHVGNWSRFGLWTLINAFGVGYHPVHNTWVQLNCKEPGERSISIAMWVMSAISGLMAGTQIFQGKDAPFYNTGIRTMIICVSIGIAFVLLQEFIYYRHNKKAREGVKGPEEKDGDLYYYVL